MQARRTVLKLAAAGLLAWAWPGAGPARARAALPRPVPAGHGMYLVDGWLLTPADLARLGLQQA
jgi:hypothetical protein